MSPKKQRYAPLSSNQHVVGKGPGQAKEVNIRSCPKCRAKKGETCFAFTDTQFIELTSTHTSQAAKRRSA